MSEENKNNEEYGASNIQVLEGLEAVRKRPAMYIGDVGQKGLHHLVYEVVDNSIDEALAGHCSDIDVFINEDNSITVKDNGRGIPTAMHEKEKKSALEVVMTVLHAGGKFDKGSYKVSGGLHGVGVSCVNALSTDLRVEVHRGGKVFEQEYKIGVPQYDVREIGTTDRTGTEVTFKPDLSIFVESIYHYDILAARLRELSFLNKGINLSITDLRRKNDDGTHVNEKFFSEVGLQEFVTFLDSTRDPILDSVIYFDGEKNGVPVEVAMVYNSSYSENVHSYVNNINTHEGGTHLAGFRRALTRTLKKYADESGLLKKVKFEVSGDDFREGKITLPVILAFHRGNDEERNFWRRTLEDLNQEKGDLEYAIELTNKHRALQDTVERARHYGAIARDAVGIFEDCPEKTALIGAIDFCIHRAF